MALDEVDFTVLHGLAVRRRAGVDGLEQTTGLDRAAIERVLQRARDRDLVVAVRNDFMLSTRGEQELEGSYPDRFAKTRRAPDLVAAYERFETINKEVKALVTQWQVRPLGGAQVANDHSDSEYDDRILDRFGDVHELAEELLTIFVERLPHITRYAERLGRALERTEAGESEWLSGVRCDSYHSVWFELHEDLLRVFGKQREE